MNSSRRLFVSALGACVAACGAKSGGAPGPAKLDRERLNAEFPKLAVRAAPGTFGLGVELLEASESWVSDANARFPLQSVFKAPMAAAALAEVDAARLKLAEPMTLTELDLSVPVSAINEAWPTPPDHHSMTMPAIDLIALAVQRSDNTAADAVLKRIGGPGALTAWLRGKSIDDISIDRYERELQVEVSGMPPFQPAWKDEKVFIAERTSIPPQQREAAMRAYLADARDTTTLPAALDFLHQLGRGELLSRASTRLLLRLMTATFTGPRRLRAGLPSGASLAHKTGTSATDLGLTPATNDIGIVTLKNGHRFAIAAFVAGSTATEAEREGLIADGARLVSKCVS